MPKIQQPVKKVEVEKEGQYGIERDHDLPWSEKKVALFKALKGLKATSETKAATAQQVVEASGGTLQAKDVRHYGYHAKAGGLVEVAKIEGTKGYSFYLTAAGSAVNPEKALALQIKEKEAKANKPKKEA